MNIKYTGKKPQFTDNIYGTKLTWIKDITVHKLDSLTARRFLRHIDCFTETTDEQNEDSSFTIKKELPVSNSEIMRDSVARMDNKDALSGFAFTNFGGIKLAENLTVDQARAEVITLIDRFGLPSDYLDLPKEEPAPIPTLEEQVFSLSNQGLTMTEIGEALSITRQKATAIINANK
jgi:hypothetical protein